VPLIKAGSRRWNPEKRCSAVYIHRKNSRLCTHRVLAEFSFPLADGTLNNVIGRGGAVFRWAWNHRKSMCAGLALLLYLTGLGRPALWEPDEGRYAEIAREMVVSHDYITPRNNFVRYFEKPPLVYWLTAAALKVFGQNEFAVRLQAAIASVGQVAIVAALGERMFGAITGILAALTLALSPLFFAFARFATPDPALAFFLTAAMACFYISVQPVEPGGIHPGWIIGAAAMLALGTLTKGPVALLLGGAIALLWLIIEGRSRQMLGIPWLKSSALYLIITLPWFIVVARRNPDFLNFFIIHEHFQRYLQSTEHGWGAWFYVPITIAGTWPWFFFFPMGLSGSVNRGSLKKKTVTRTGSGDANDQQGALHFLLIWFAVVFVFFSIPRSKLGEYILPALPPIAIVAARGLARIDNLATAERQRLLMIFAGINIASAIAIATIAITVVPAQGLSHALGRDAIIIAAALLTGGTAALVLAGRETSTITLALAISVIAGLGGGMDARERVAPLVSYRRLAGIITPYANRGCRLLSYRHFEQGLPFYTGARETLVNYRGELEPFGPLHDPYGRVFATTSQLRKSWSGSQCLVLIANRSDLPVLAKLLSPEPTLIGCEGKKLALYNERPGTSVQNPAVASCGDRKS
jgi:4-amino-4-deoxy-L-arabinose transferase-like glycosyltransferase